MQLLRTGCRARPSLAGCRARPRLAWLARPAARPCGAASSTAPCLQELLPRVRPQFTADSTSLPPAASVKEVAVVEEIHEQLENVFLSKGGYRISQREKREIEATGGSATYGELLPDQLPKVFDYLGLDSSSVFVDLGSGTGKTVLIAALGNVVKRAVGIELSASRHEQAEAALQVVDGLDMPHSPVDLRCEDIALADISDGTHFYLCSTAFGASLCRKMAERLSECPNFQVLVTTRELPFQPFLQQVGEFRCSYSWIADSNAYVYVKSFQTAPPALLVKMFSVDGVCYLPTGVFLPTVKLEQDVEDSLSITMKPLEHYARAPLL